MENSFFGFYNPTPAQFDQLWREGTIVLDANAILDLYRLPPKARDELFSALEYFKDRLWLPYQVALEYQRNRFTVIAERRSSTSAVFSATTKLLNDLKDSVSELKLDQYEAQFNSDEVLKEMDAPLNKLLAAISDVQKSELDVSQADPIRQRLDKIFENRIGHGPKNQIEMDALVRDAEARFDAKQPPGFADEKRKNKSRFVHDGLLYTNCYGDLILWRQVIEYAKNNNIKQLMFVTGDKKEDWWWREAGKTIGPHQELVREIRRDGGVETFWMMTPDRFLEQSAQYSQKKVSVESVSELNSLIAQQPLLDLNEIGASIANGVEDVLRERLAQTNERAVAKWLGSRFDIVQLRRSFPTFLAARNGMRAGFHVITWDGSMLSGKLQVVLKQGQSLLDTGHFEMFTVIIMLAADQEMLSDRLLRRMRHWERLYPEAEIIMGSVDSKGMFEAWTTEMRAYSNNDEF